MNKYFKNMINITLIVVLALILFAYWLDLRFGYGQIFLMIGGGYAVYLNFKTLKKEA